MCLSLLCYMFAVSYNPWGCLSYVDWWLMSCYQSYASVLYDDVLFYVPSKLVSYNWNQVMRNYHVLLLLACCSMYVYLASLQIKLGNVGLVLIRATCLCWIYVDYTTSPGLHHVTVSLLWIINHLFSAYESSFHILFII